MADWVRPFRTITGWVLRALPTTDAARPRTSYGHTMVTAALANARFMSASCLVASHNSGSDRPGQIDSPT